MFTHARLFYNRIKQALSPPPRVELTGPQLVRYNEIQREIAICIQKESNIAEVLQLAANVLQSEPVSRDRDSALLSIAFFPALQVFYQQKRLGLEQEREALRSSPPQEGFEPFQGEGHSLASVPLSTFN